MEFSLLILPEGVDNGAYVYRRSIVAQYKRRFLKDVLAFLELILSL